MTLRQLEGRVAAAERKLGDAKAKFEKHKSGLEEAKASGTKGQVAQRKEWKAAAWSAVLGCQAALRDAKAELKASEKAARAASKPVAAKDRPKAKPAKAVAKKAAPKKVAAPKKAKAAKSVPFGAAVKEKVRQADPTKLTKGEIDRSTPSKAELARGSRDFNADVNAILAGGTAGRDVILTDRTKVGIRKGRRVVSDGNK